MSIKLILLLAATALARPDPSTLAAREDGISTGPDEATPPIAHAYHEAREARQNPASQQDPPARPGSYGQHGPSSLSLPPSYATPIPPHRASAPLTVVMPSAPPKPYTHTPLPGIQSKTLSEEWKRKTEARIRANPRKECAFTAERMGMVYSPRLEESTEEEEQRFMRERCAEWQGVAGLETAATSSCSTAGAGRATPTGGVRPPLQPLQLVWGEPVY